jgi:hypothetical protein
VWTGAWTGAAEIPSVMCSHSNLPVAGSSPARPTWGFSAWIVVSVDR